MTTGDQETLRSREPTTAQPSCLTVPSVAADVDELPLSCPVRGRSYPHKVRKCFIHFSDWCTVGPPTPTLLPTLIASAAYACHRLSVQNFRDNSPTVHK